MAFLKAAPVNAGKKGLRLKEMKKSHALWAKEVKAAAGFACQFCGSTEKLESHHIKPVCDFPELRFDISNGVCLCHSCHVKAHGGAFFRFKNAPYSYYRGQTNCTKEEYTAITDFINGLAVAK